MARTWSALPLVTALALMLGACTAEPGATEPDPTSTTSPAAAPSLTETTGGLFQAYLRQPGSIDPGRAIDPEELTVVDQVFDSLTAVEMTDDGQVRIVPGAAESWEANPAAGEDAPPAASVWTFTLREGATFHDGSPVTAEAFARAWSRITDRTSDQPSAAFYLLESVAGFSDASEGGELAGVEAVDERTLRVTLDEPIADFPAIASHPALAPVPSAADADPDGFAQMPVGNGPFRMAEPVQSGQYIRLEPYLEHPDQGEGASLDEVVFQIYSGEDAVETAYDDFEKGFLELAPVPPARVEEAAQTYGRSTDGYNGTGVLDGAELITAFYGFNVEVPPFDDPAVRRAISLLVDRQEIVSDVVAGRVHAASVVPPGIAGYEPAECDFCTYEPDRAREVLGETEVPGFDLVYYEGGGHDAVAQRVQRDVNAVLGEGTMRLKPLSQADWLQTIREGQAGFFLSGWLAEYPAADTFLYPLFHASRIDQDNLTRYDNPQLNEVLEQARRELAPDVRADLYRQAEAIVLQDMPVVPLFHYRHNRVVSDRVEGFSLSPIGDMDLVRVTVRPRE